MVVTRQSRPQRLPRFNGPSGSAPPFLTPVDPEHNFRVKGHRHQAFFTLCLRGRNFSSDFRPVHSAHTLSDSQCFLVVSCNVPSLVPELVTNGFLPKVDSSPGAFRF